MIPILTESIDRNTVKNIFAAIREAGGQAYLAGGCVRDQLMGKEPHDADFVVRGFDTLYAVRDALDKHFGRENIKTGDAVGEKHHVLRPVINGEVYDISLPRIDHSTGDSKQQNVSYSDKSITLRTDSDRRDFTVNAMYMDEGGNIIDYHGGQEDIARGVVRAVGDPAQRFAEDGTRILRAIRFAVKFGFTIEDETARAIEQNLFRLDEDDTNPVVGVHPPGLAEEFVKAAKKMSDNGQYLEMLKKTGIGRHLYGGDFSPIHLGGFNGSEDETVLANFVAMFLHGGNMDRMAVQVPWRKALGVSRAIIAGQVTELKRPQVSFFARLFQSLAGYESLGARLHKKLLGITDRSELALSGDEVAKITGVKGENIRLVLNTLISAVQNKRVENRREDLIEFLNSLPIRDAQNES